MPPQRPPEHPTLLARANTIMPAGPFRPGKSGSPLNGSQAGSLKPARAPDADDVELPVSLATQLASIAANVAFMTSEMETLKSSQDEMKAEVKKLTENSRDKDDALGEMMGHLERIDGQLKVRGGGGGGKTGNSKRRWSVTSSKGDADDDEEHESQYVLLDDPEIRQLLESEDTLNEVRHE